MAYLAVDCPAWFSLYGVFNSSLEPPCHHDDQSRHWCDLGRSEFQHIAYPGFRDNFQKLTWSRLEHRRLLWLGTDLTFDNARDPNWYRFEEQWAPWTPTSFLTQQRPWYNLLETAVPVEEREGGWSMAEIQCWEYALNLTQVQACIHYIVTSMSAYPTAWQCQEYSPGNV